MISPVTFIGQEVFVPITDKIVPQIKPYYTISNRGSIYSSYSNKYLSPGIDSKGYPYVALSTFEGPKNCRIHRLVKMSFEYFEGCENIIINHQDGNKMNPCLWNLEWSTYSDNMKHAISTKLISRVGSYGNLSDKQVISICELLMDTKLSLKNIADMTNNTLDTIYSILYKKAHNHISDKYTFPNREINGYYSRVFLVTEMERLCEYYQNTKSIRHTMNKHDYLISALNYIGANINNTTIRTAERILYRMSNTKISQNYDF